ncbi:hypothetical protein RM780_14015 [Streptomyces sp. DSM 44917]|uniref:Lipoprotein n=1 Tax=Streptomyces boetiae TaxID=3075541 RepID=A0ABU2L920_9ACTN|nr:hypothetical protein [Streptomyces sp. DSM 44917]MDT0308071.1 hypothetical protein [Streptomyces sp. DSM 44917]
MRCARTAALTLTAAALVAGTAACSGSGDDGRPAGGGSAFEAVQAAAESTADTTSARVDAVMTMPPAAGGTVEMAGAMSWDPELAMELTMSGDAMAADPSMPEETTVVWADDVMYMQMGEEFAAQYQGRGWLGMNLTELAEETGNPALGDAMSMGLDEANQDPAQQLAILLQSPEIELVGEERLEDGTRTSHYRGTIAVDDALENNGAADLLSEGERQELADMMRQQGIEAYDIDVWVDGNDFPVQIHQAYDTHQGPVSYEARYSDFGTEVSAEAPPAGEVVDIMELLSAQGVTG